MRERVRSFMRDARMLIPDTNKQNYQAACVCFCYRVGSLHGTRTGAAQCGQDRLTMTYVSLAAFHADNAITTATVETLADATAWLTAQDAAGARGYEVNSNYSRFWQDAERYARCAFGGTWHVVTDEYAQDRWEMADIETAIDGEPVRWTDSDCKSCWDEVRYMENCGVAERYPNVYAWLDSGGRGICPYCRDIKCWEESDGGCGEW